MVNAPSAEGSNASNPLTLFVPSPLHPAAYERCAELGIDVMLPSDERSRTWWDYADGIVLRQSFVVGKDDLRRAKRLKIVARTGVGYDMIDVQQCRELGIAVTYLPGCNAEAVAELTLCLALSVLRRTNETDRRLRAGESVPSVHNLGLSLFGKTVGLVGMGDIAREVAKKFNYASSCRVLVYSPTSPPTRWTKASPNPDETILPHERVSSLDELLERSDVVSLHCPEVPETRRMMSTEQFARMKPTAVFLNLGRGGLVDEDALIEACRTRRIFGAGLDVFETEPVSAAAYGETLFKLDNVVTVPHIGASTIEVARDTTITAVETAYAYCRGEGFGNSALVKEMSAKDLLVRQGPSNS